MKKNERKYEQWVSDVFIREFGDKLVQIKLDSETGPTWLSSTNTGFSMPMDRDLAISLKGKTIRHTENVHPGTLKRAMEITNQRLKPKMKEIQWPSETDEQDVHMLYMDAGIDSLILPNGPFIYDNTTVYFKTEPENGVESCYSGVYDRSIRKMVTSLGPIIFNHEFVFFGYELVKRLKWRQSEHLLYHRTFLQNFAKPYPENERRSDDDLEVNYG